jgi:fructuronate reductase
VHLGLGAFFRAFGGDLCRRCGRLSGGDWGIIGVSLQSPVTRDRLAQQDFVYTVVTQEPGDETFRKVEIVQDVLVAPEEPRGGSDMDGGSGNPHRHADGHRKGLLPRSGNGRLNLDHPDIIHDLENPLPRSAPGFLVRALQRRRDAGQPPFTVLTCDNLPDNGRLVRRAVLDLAGQIDPALADWIADEGRFPSTMVDRITPATKPEDIERLAQKMGYRDQAPVMCEPFRQWVMEDDFVRPMEPMPARTWLPPVPRWCADVTPYEHMKLRMLNGTHSSLAYLGYLAGHETIAETVADPVFAAFVKRLWRRRSSRPSRRRRVLISKPMRMRCSSGIPTRPSGIGPGRSPWTAARSCRSAFWERSPTICLTRADPARGLCSRSRAGCATSADR